MSLIRARHRSFAVVFIKREIIRQKCVLQRQGAAEPFNGPEMSFRSSALPVRTTNFHYSVTENCQNCAGKACINACKFGAIEAGRHRSHIDASKCKECGKCAQACPYNAIAHLKRPCKFSCPVNAITYDDAGISVIDKDEMQFAAVSAYIAVRSARSVLKPRSYR